MSYITLTPPNTCALVLVSDTFTYVTGGPTTKIYPAEGYTGIEEFVTPSEALARALELDPSYDPNLILGPLDPEPEDVSSFQQVGYEGGSVEIRCQYTCGTASVDYKWLDPKGIHLPGETSSTLILTELTKAYEGIYTCQVTCKNSEGQTGGENQPFQLTVLPVVDPSVSELA